MGLKWGSYAEGVGKRSEPIITARVGSMHSIRYSSVFMIIGRLLFEFNGNRYFVYFRRLCFGDSCA